MSLLHVFLTPPPLHVPTIYRILHRRYRDEPFSGKGGLHYRSRWASKGQLVSYAADHLATATLEKISGVKRADLLTEMVYAKAEVDASLVEVLPEAEWPEDWKALPAPDTTRAVGDAWLASAQSLLLRVPSVVLPDSYNYVVNAAHPAMGELHVKKVESLLLDNRILAQLGVRRP